MIKEPDRPVSLTIAGFDPSGGAGVLADIKTFELFRVYGIAVITSNTIQNDIRLKKIEWVDKDTKEECIATLAERMSVQTVKLGMHRNLDDVLHSVRCVEKYFQGAHIVWDPIIASSSGYQLEWTLSEETLNKILSSIILITPNLPEFQWLFQKNDPVELIKNSPGHAGFLIKGGHSTEKLTIDRLYQKNKNVIEYSAEREDTSKHGSGCVLSAGIAAGLAKGLSLEESVWHSKDYITGFFKSNNHILGYHFN
jgi:hydroxymethylpyrimidine/phosphomethylpyrimidine kinase